MKELILTPRRMPSIPVEAEVISPDVVAGLTLADVEGLGVHVGNRVHPLKEFFNVEGELAETAAEQRIVVDGTIQTVKYVGARMTAGSILVRGCSGMHTGAQMSGGEIVIEGNTRDWAGAEMKGGLLVIKEDSRNQTGAAYRGSAEGMTGGCILVEGDAGTEVGAFMRRGMIVVKGDLGPLAGAHMNGGTIFVFGRASRRMGVEAQGNGGFIACLGAVESLLPTYVYDTTYRPAFMKLYLRQIRDELGVEEAGEFIEAAFRRYRGDASVGGGAEILIAGTQLNGGLRLKVGIIATDRGEWHVQRLTEKLEERGAEAYFLPTTRFRSAVGLEPKVSVRGYALDDYDAVIVRKVPGGTPEQVFYRMDVLHRLEDLGVCVVNPAESIERAVDKYYTSTLLEDAGLPTPRTVITESSKEAMEAFEELGGDVVVKSLFGSLGAGMTRLSDPEVAYRVFKALELTRSVYYLQEFIPHGGEDVRAFVVGGEVVASMKRRSDGWKTNLSAGGRAEPFELGEDLAELSLRATEKIGLEYSGVDLLRSKVDGRAYVVELNSTPGWEGLQSVSEVDVAGRLLDHIQGMLE